MQFIACSAVLLCTRHVGTNTIPRRQRPLHICRGVLISTLKTWIIVIVYIYYCNISLGVVVFVLVSATVNIKYRWLLFWLSGLTSITQQFLDILGETLSGTVGLAGTVLLKRATSRKKLHVQLCLRIKGLWKIKECGKLDEHFLHIIVFIFLKDDELTKLINKRRFGHWMYFLLRKNK